MSAFGLLLGELPAEYPLPLLVVQHLHTTDAGRFTEHLNTLSAIDVCEAMDKVKIVAPHVYIAPANYHLLVERGGFLALSVDSRVRWSRPSIDVLFESAARVWAEGLIGVILSGANDDGARGLNLIRELGGLCLAQDPDTAESPMMPRSAIDLAQVELVLSPQELGRKLVQLANNNAGRQKRVSCEELV